MLCGYVTIETPSGARASSGRERAASASAASRRAAASPRGCGTRGPARPSSSLTCVAESLQQTLLRALVHSGSQRVDVDLLRPPLDQVREAPLGEPVARREDRSLGAGAPP